MDFKINHDTWKILKKDTKTLVDKYNSGNEDNAKFAFGVTIFPQHEIWINEDMCFEQQIRTLKHELTHCYLWNSGLAQIINYDEETVCEIVASINDFINDVIYEYHNF